MKNFISSGIVVLSALLSACGGGGSDAPAPAAAPVVPVAVVAQPAPSVDVYVILQMGQSNAVGRAEVQRLKNATNNPRGYVANPAKVKIYDKGNMADPDFSKDNGKWVDYYAGVNSNTDGSPLDHFGPELALSQKIVRETGKEVYIIKAAFGGTALSPGIPTYAPGNWTDTNHKIAMDYFFAPAMRDLRAARPNANIKFLGVVWWQGESDAAAGITGPDYSTRFAQFKAYADNKIAAQFTGYKWALVGLSYARDTKESAINAAMCGFASGSVDSYHIPTLQYPSKNGLTAQQAAPFALGANDDIHSSYITQLAVGEQAADVLLGRVKAGCGA